MAIGSQPEIGVEFTTLPKDEHGTLDGEQMKKIYAAWRKEVGDDLLGGYATLIQNRREESVTD